MTPYDFTGEAKLVVPQGHGSTSSPTLQPEATHSLPKGHTSIASDPHESEASGPLPQGQTQGASLSPSPDAARLTQPQGQHSIAASDPSCEAIQSMPQGQIHHASQPNLSGEAMVSQPSGHSKRASLAQSISIIRELHRRRQDLHRAEKSLTLQAKAICRRLCDGDKKAAEVVYKDGLTGENSTAWVLLTPYVAARTIFEDQRKTVEKQLEREAKSLPVAEWVKTVPGFGWGSLAAVVGEAGDLSAYPKKGHLWKRMGLAVIDGGRQRKVAGDAAIDHGYSPVRRSIVWNIGDCLIKAQSARVDKETGEIIKPAGPMRQLYDERKAYESERVETAGHAHNRAKRYIEKRLIRDLWNAWRAAA